MRWLKELFSLYSGGWLIIRANCYYKVYKTNMQLRLENYDLTNKLEQTQKELEDVRRNLEQAIGADEKIRSDRTKEWTSSSTP